MEETNLTNNDSNSNIENNKRLSNKKKLNIAVIGCLHGKLCEVYETLMEHELKTKKPIDMVLITGDFQSIRKKDDLSFIKVPEKYKHQGDFPAYYNRKKRIPYKTIFIGGNHEASNILNDFFNGGYITKNLYYLGKTGVIRYKGVTIAGVSGIYDYKDYYKGHYESESLSTNNIVSIYHLREYDIVKLNLLLQTKIDIFLSHDWPWNVVNEKDRDGVCKVKKYWSDLADNTMGNYPCRFLMEILKPRFWLSSHMHYYYTNKINSNDNSNDKSNSDSSTTFIALDKILPDKNRKWLDFIELEVSEDDYYRNNEIEIVPEWLGICKNMNKYFPYNTQYYNYCNFILNKSCYFSIINKSKNHSNSNKQGKVVSIDKNFFYDLNNDVNQLSKGNESLVIKDLFNSEESSLISNMDYILKQQKAIMDVVFYDKVQGKVNGKKNNEGFGNEMNMSYGINHDFNNDGLDIHNNKSLSKNNSNLNCEISNEQRTSDINSIHLKESLISSNITNNKEDRENKDINILGVECNDNIDHINTYSNKVVNNEEIDIDNFWDEEE